MPPGAPRVLFIGLDGMPWRVLHRRFERGETPFLQELVDGGCSGAMMSVTPPVTAPAWTTFQTGVSPASHGIHEFSMLRPGTYETWRPDASSHSIETMWEAVSRHGGRVVAVNVPMTWPPREVNGILASGMLTPSVESEFVYPQGMREPLLAAAPGYEILIPSAKAHGMGLEAYTLALAKMAESRAAFGREALRLVPDADLAMVHFQAPDVLMHAAYPACDPADPRHTAEGEDTVGQFWRALDRAVESVARPALEAGGTVIALSDHGFGPIDRIAYANAFLVQGGWQARRPLQTALRGAMSALRRALPSSFARRLSRVRGLAGRVASTVTNWSGTEAFQSGGWVGAFICLNRKGIYPKGCVADADAPGLLAELAAAFEAWRGPDGRRVVERAMPGGEIWPGCSPPDVPDLYLEPHCGAELNAIYIESDPGPHPTDPANPNRHHLGSHRSEGVYMAAGPTAGNGKGPDHQLADLLPTALALLGLPAGDHLEGRVMEGVFPGLGAVGSEAEAAGSPQMTPGNPGDDEETTRRLRDLGYL